MQTPPSSGHRSCPSRRPPPPLPLLLAAVCMPAVGAWLPGEPGVDYPLMAAVPDTDFTCEDKPVPGYYADVEAECQAFWICQGPSGRGTGFLCPNGTLFNQETLVCEWWQEVDCSRAEALYGVNVAVALAAEAARLGGPAAAAAAYRRRRPAALWSPAARAALARLLGPSGYRGRLPGGGPGAQYLAPADRRPERLLDRSYLPPDRV